VELASKSKKSLNGRVILVTGGARGIGYEIAEELLKQGAGKVALCDILEESVLKAAQSLNAKYGNCYGYKCDVTNKSDVETLYTSLLRDIGHVDVVFSNAGIMRYKKLLEKEERDFRQAIDVNLTSQYNIVKVFLPPMIEQGQGNLVFTASQLAFSHMPGLSDYIATKHGMVGLVTSLDDELQGTGVKTTLICPYGVDTDLVSTISQSLSSEVKDHFLLPEEVAKVAVEALQWETKCAFVPKSLLFFRYFLGCYLTKLWIHSQNTSRDEIKIVQCIL